MSQLHVLEATIVVIIMVGAVTFVSTFESPVTVESRIEHALEVKGSDFLALLQDSPIAPHCSGRDELERLVIDGVNGDHSLWHSRARRTFPPGFEANLWLWNQREYYPLHVREDFKGTAVSRTLYPNWTWTKAVAEVEEVSGLESLTVSVPGLSNGRAARLAGDSVEVQAIWTSAVGERTQGAWSGTALARPTVENDRQASVISLEWSETVTGPRNLTRSINISDVGPGRAETTFVLHPRAVGSIRAGTAVLVELPEGWSIVGAMGSNWDAVVHASGQAATFTAEDSAAGVLTLNAQRGALPDRPYEVLTASVSGPSRTVSNLVVYYPGLADRSLPRLVYPAVPYPLVTGELATFGVAFANGGENVTVREVSFSVPGGYDTTHNQGRGAAIFGSGSSIVPLQPVPELYADDSWEISPDHKRLTWRGVHEVDAGAAASWLVSVRATADTSQVTSIEPAASPGPYANATFSNEFSYVGSQWGQSPGVLRLRIPPASTPYATSADGSDDGYPWSAAAELKGTQLTYEMRMVDARGFAEAQGKYRIGATAGDVTRLQSSIANSSFRPMQRMVPVGGELVVRGQMESILTTLAQGGIEEAELTVEMYAPPSMGCEPTASVTRSVSSLPSVEVTEMLVWDDALTPGLIVGTSDGHVARVDGAGVRQWFTDVGAPTRLARADFGILEGSWLLAGDGDGTVTMLAPDDGDVAWTYDAGASVRALEPRASPPGILVATSAGALHLLDEDGALAADELLAGAIDDAAFSASGDVLVLGPAALTRLSAALEVEQTLPLVEAPLGFAVGSNVVYATPFGAQVLTADEFAPVAVHSFVSPATNASAGDATGDGVEDLVVGFLNMSIAILDGATGSAAYHALEDAMPTQLEAPSMPSEFERPEADLACTSVGEETYSMSCDVRAGTERIFGIAAGGGHASVYYSTGASYSVIESFDATGESGEVWLYGDDAVLAVGDWMLGDKGAIGRRDGWVELYDPDVEGGELTARNRPSDRIGDFQLRFRVPAGGFYGTHLLVARLSWTAPGGMEQAANLVDWFEVVGPDGVPVLHPAYSVVLVVRDMSSTGLT